MYSFANDYSEGACPEVLDALIRDNNTQCAGYGLDQYCALATRKIRKIIDDSDIDVHFLSAGTPCNVVAISMLRSHEAVISVESGHINVHETGAVEATGHKIITVKGKNGKITPEEIEQVIASHPDEHMVKPKMVFISDATELGTIYYKDELQKIYDTCRKYDLYLYLDGARLSNALVAIGNDLTLKDICTFTDMFYLGGTKNGAYAGEMMIVSNDALKEDFRYYEKQHCAMLAKGRFLGSQMLALLEDNVYLNNARNANIMAQALAYIFKQLDFKMYIESPTNQIFPIIENRLLEKIQNKYIVTPWGPYDENHTIVRFVCSWATKKTIVQEFYTDLVTFLNMPK